VRNGHCFRAPASACRAIESPSTPSFRSRCATADSSAHVHEHAIEVQLPLLSAHSPGAKIAALCLARLTLEECRKLGSDIACALRESNLAASTLIVASSDMSHYISADRAARLDRLAIDRIVALDAEGLYRTVSEHDISMCGFVPTTVMLFAARELGAQRAELVRYGNSGERSGDYTRVVGYAGMIVA
jgi:MEMO1 family protein